MPLFVRFRRQLFAVLALVNVGATPLAMAGEAQRMAAGIAQGRHNHIEDHSRPGCAPVHPDECDLCTFLAHATPERCSVAHAVFVEASVRDARRDLAERRHGALLARPRTRAPPIAV